MTRQRKGARQYYVVTQGICVVGIGRGYETGIGDDPRGLTLLRNA